MVKFDLENANLTLKNTLAETLDIQFIECRKGFLKATMPVDRRTHQPYGLLHGGASVALAETVASMGGWMLVADQEMAVVGQEINANHLRSIRSGRVTAVGEPLHQGKRSQVWQVKIYDEQERMVCISRCTLAVVKVHRSK